MRNATSRVGVAAGPGLVGRFGDAVVLVAGDGGPADDLLDLVESAASESEQPGAAIVARLAGWIGAHLPADDVAFGLVAPVPDGVVVFLRGRVWAEVTGAETTTTLSGRRALTWVDQVVPLPFERLAIGSGAEGAVRVHPRSALLAGVVPGEGFVVTPAGEPAAPADPDRPTAEAVVPRPREHPDGLQDTIAAPVRGRQSAAESRETAMAPPPVGALVAEGGPTVLLDRSYVLGREPQNDPEVQSAAASPVVIRDPDNLVSRVHARVAVDGARVFVRDAPSVSGTWIAAPGAETWTRVGTEPTALLPGWSLRIGKQMFVFQPTRAEEPDPH